MFCCCKYLWQGFKFGLWSVFLVFLVDLCLFHYEISKITNFLALGVEMLHVVSKQGPATTSHLSRAFSNNHLGVPCVTM